MLGETLIMKIKNVECFVLLQSDMDSEACSSAQDNLVVRITTDTGIHGIGETDTSPWVARAMIEAPGTHIMSLGLKEMLIGQDPLETTALWQKLYTFSAMTGRRGVGVNAIGAIDMALWDIKGKAYGKPIWRLLGGSNRKSFTPYASLLPGATKTYEEYKKELIYRLVQAKKYGFQAAKLEVCLQGPYSHNGIQENNEKTIETVAACREAVGADMTLMVDVAYAWQDVYEALRVLKKIEPYDIYFIETPLPSDDLEGYSRLAALTPIRVAAGEWLTGRYEFKEWIEKGQLAVLQPDIGRVGGITEAKRVVEMAEDHGRLIVPHCWKSAIGIAASLHVCAGAPNAPFLEFLPAELSDSPIRKALTKNDFQLIDGRLPLPETAGLGIELNEEALVKFRVD
jgi:L-alanine-DL-glutamate epimerase-like enolase superfamily enzyme